MNKYLKSSIYTFSFLIGLTLFTTLLNYINILNGKTLLIVNIIVSIISLFIGGFVIGKNSSSKGWLNGIKIGGINIGIFLILSILLKFKFAVFSIIYYIILMIFSILGSMVGISKSNINE